MALRAVVVGGGIGGIAAAVALARAGIDVQVHEQAQQLTEVGAGVSLAPNGLRMLARLGVGEQVRRVGARYVSAQLRFSDGRALRHEPYQFTQPGRNIGIHRADLLALLAGQLPPGTVRTGHRCTGFRQDAGGATVIFADGSTATADVVIAADGIHSALQGFVVAPAEPVFSGVKAYRGLVPRLDAYPADTMRMWVGESKHFLVFPVRAGQLLNYVGFVPSDTAVRESWSAPGDIAALAAHFAGWDPVIGQVIAAISGPGGSGFQWGMYDREPLPRWSSGRLTLLGDAAHPMLPHLGQGANQALEDAVTLATLLGAGTSSADVPRALAAYEGLRRDRTARVQLGSRRQGAGWDSSGSQLIDRRWIYEYDAWAEAAARTRADSRRLGRLPVHGHPGSSARKLRARASSTSRSTTCRMYCVALQTGGKPIVIVGSGLAGGNAAATLREEGFPGPVVLISPEPGVPFGRPPLSKTYLRSEEDLDGWYVRPAGWYADHDIELRRGPTVAAVDPAAHTVTLDNGEELGYAKILIATGGRNRRLKIPGAGLPGIHYLRTLAECDAIKAEAVPGRRAVVVGMGFIGCEVAASLTQLGVQVTAVFPGRAPLERVLGGQVGARIGAIHRAKGVELRPGDQVTAFEGAERVEAFVTAAGDRIPCDFAVAGIGIEPVIPPVAVEQQNGILTDELCRASAPDVYAAGDVANQLHPLFGRVRVEHYNNAEKHGRAAARSMLGSTAPYDYLYTFWSDQYEHKIEYAGHVDRWDEFVVRGSVEEGKLIGFYLVDGDVRAAVGLDRGGDPELDLDGEMAASARLVSTRARPSPAVLADDRTDLWSLTS